MLFVRIALIVAVCSCHHLPCRQDITPSSPPTKIQDGADSPPHPSNADDHNVADNNADGNTAEDTTADNNADVDADNDADDDTDNDDAMHMTDDNADNNAATQTTCKNADHDDDAAAVVIATMQTTK
jgi:hypothetical protein